MKHNKNRLSEYMEGMDKLEDIDEANLPDIGSGIEAMLQLADYIKTTIDSIDITGQGTSVDKKFGQMVKEVRLSSDKLKRYLKTNKKKLTTKGNKK